ncbi:MAG: TRAP transporter small permease [Castellaniella sp.]|uniref:TRAP transporter small permease subunit n=1 Tax=Castellaniella sp. TaxID=1955812 RepID=UPI003A93B94C
MARPNLIANACLPIAKAAAYVAGYALIVLSLLITYDVIVRKVFNAPSLGTDEIGGYIVAVMAAFGFTYALLKDAHTRIDIFYQWLPRRLRLLANLLAMSGMAAYACFMAWRAWGTLAESIEYGSTANTPLHTPQWIPQSIWLLGLVLFAAVAVLLLLHAVWLMVRGHSHQALQFYGPKTLEEEIQEERLSVDDLDGRPSTLTAAKGGSHD